MGMPVLLARWQRATPLRGSGPTVDHIVPAAETMGLALIWSLLAGPEDLLPLTQGRHDP